MTAYRRLVLVILLTPTVTAALGIDGGAIFQIFATENLGLSAEALGIGFGLGILSVPVQLWAARMPLWRARRNIQIFLGIAAAQCVVLAAVVAFSDAGDRLALVALAITVLAEINLSVLWATAWQPLVSFGLTVDQRQRINSRWGAGARAILAVLAVLFGAMHEPARVVFLLAAAGVCVWLILAMTDVPVPPRTPAPPRDSLVGPRVTPAMRRMFLVVGLLAAGVWPLFVVYAQDVLWPTVNLGVLAALRLGGTLAAAMLWRPTEGDVTARGRLAALAAVVAALGLAFVPTPVDGPVTAAIVVVCTTAGAAFGTTVFMTLLELAHRSIDPENSVRSMTLYDVVASTSMQAGLLVAGFLVALSADWARWGTDPYRAYLVVVAVAVWFALRWATQSAPPSPEPPPPAPRPAAQ